MSTGIASTKFSLKPLNEGAYMFDIQFLDGAQVSMSRKQFTFQQACIPVEGEVWDVYSQNGSCGSDILANLFHKKDAKAVGAVSSLLQETASGRSKGTVCLVLDLQGPDHKYLSPEWHRRFDC